MIKPKNTNFQMIGEFEREPNIYAPSMANFDMFIKLNHHFI